MNCKGAFTLRREGPEAVSESGREEGKQLKKSSRRIKKEAELSRQNEEGSRSKQ